MQANEYYSVKGRITAVYLGQRVSEKHKDLLQRLVPESIPIRTVRINPTTLRVEPKY